MVENKIPPPIFFEQRPALRSTIFIIYYFLFLIYTAVRFKFFSRLWSSSWAAPQNTALHRQ